MTHRFTLATLLACTALLCSAAVLAAPRVVLVEELTSQTCPPCYGANPDIEAMLDSYGDQVVSVKWHVWWPSPGDDWFYLINNPVISNRVSVFYSGPSHGAPSLYIDGGPPNPALTPGEEAPLQIDARLLIPSPLALSGTAVTRTATSTVEVSVDVNVETPPAMPPGQTSARIFAALVEEHVPIGVSYSGTLTSGSPIVTGLSGTRYLVKGSVVCASGLPACPAPGSTSSTVARIKTIDSPTQITLTKNATASGSRTLAFRSYNGETMHHDVFRMINNNATPAATGDPIDLSAAGTQHFDFSMPYAADWDHEEFAVVVWVQNMGTGNASNNSGMEVYQAAKITPTVVTVGVDPQSSGLEMLGQNRPNPFTRGTSIPFSIARTGDVNLAVYDLSGRLVRQLVRGERATGTHTARWDGRDGSGKAVSHGVFYYRLRTAGVDVTRRMVLMK